MKPLKAKADEIYKVILGLRTIRSLQCYKVYAQEKSVIDNSIYSYK